MTDPRDSHPDAAILAMEPKVRALIEQFQQACSEREDDEVAGAACEAAFDALDALMEIRATTLDGMGAKARIAGLENDYTQERLSASILADLLAMGGPPKPRLRDTDAAAA